jgi:acetylcholinesterase
MRALPFSVLKASVDKTPSFFSYQVRVAQECLTQIHAFIGKLYTQSLALVWHPSVDGVFLTDNPQSSVQQGKFANIPFVSGGFVFNGSDIFLFYIVSNPHI